MGEQKGNNMSSEFEHFKGNGKALNPNRIGRIVDSDNDTNTYDNTSFIDGGVIQGVEISPIPQNFNEINENSTNLDYFFEEIDGIYPINEIVNMTNKNVSII